MLVGDLLDRIAPGLAIVEDVLTGLSPADLERRGLHSTRGELTVGASAVRRSPLAGKSYNRSKGVSLMVFGSNATMGVAGFYRGTTTADFSQDFPVMSVVLPPGQTGIDASQMMVTGSSFRNSYMKNEIEQGRLDGHFDFTEQSRLDFGVTLTDVNNRTAFSNVQQDSWGGATNAADYPDDVWKPDTVRHYFDNIGGSGSSALFNEFFTFDFATVRQIAATVGNPAMYQADPNFSTDRRTEEKSKSGYVQYSQNWDGKVPVHVALGVRYEQTDVSSSALVPTATGINWVANNEFSVVFSNPDFTTLSGDYSFVLPSLDTSFDVRDDMKIRASVGKAFGVRVATCAADVSTACGPSAHRSG
jgi:hypothetical protein